jgi:hypothetical protein
MLLSTPLKAPAMNTRFMASPLLFVVIRFLHSDLSANAELIIGREEISVPALPGGTTKSG